MRGISYHFNDSNLLDIDKSSLIDEEDENTIEPMIILQMSYLVFIVNIFIYMFI